MNLKNFMNNKYLVQLKTLVLTALKEESVQVVLFGSQARGDHNRASDVDIGIIPLQKWAVDKRKLSALKEKIENLNIPYKVELVNLALVDGSFRAEVLKDAILWKEK